MSVSQACSTTNTADLARALLSLGQSRAITTAGIRAAHAGIAMCRPQMHQCAARALNPVSHRRALANITDMLSCAARPGDPPRAVTYPMSMDAHASVACQQALAGRLRLFEFMPDRQHPVAGSLGQP